MLLVDGKPTYDKNCHGLAVPHGAEDLVRAAFAAGAHACLALPVAATEIAALLARLRQGKPPGRHANLVAKALADLRRFPAN